MQLRPVLLLLALASMTAIAVTPADYAATIERWRADRSARLQQPQGWLSLVGLHWIEPGTYRIGREPANDVVLATGPARLGVVRLDGGRLFFSVVEGVAVTLDGAPVETEVELRPDSSGQPGTLAFDAGEASIQLIERSGRYALRVRDARAHTRSGFTGIEHYPIDSAWRHEARFEAHPPGKTIDIANVIGQLQPMPNPGALVFEHDGATHRIEAVAEADGSLFLIFADRTNGRETYGAGRFLYTDAPDGDRVVVDFNKAYNPPCAFNAYSTCPLPPPENRLDLAVTAGEKKYTGPTH
jgi:uncharacterized protein (DUF1684 family)